ncbi:MAG: restriction endonuclease subunit S [Paludibacteraceae bacterium]
MSKLQDLINSLCPNGVEFKPLGEVCDFKRGDTLSSKDAIDGDVPVMAGGQKPSCYHNVANRKGETIVVAGSGAYAGFVTYWNIPVFVSDAFSVNPSNCLLPKYVFYFLKNNQEKIHATKKGAGVPHVHGKDIAKFLIPIPPLAVQEEIVRILDRFADYAAELQAELQARKAQYEYYRNLLLTFDTTASGTNDELKDSITNWGGHSYTIQWKTMGEICKDSSNIKWKDFPSKSFLYIDLASVDCDSHSISNDLTLINKDNAPSRAQQIINTNDVLFGTTRPTLMRFAFVPENLNGNICSTGYAILRANTQIVSPRFLYYILNTNRFYQFVENNQEGAGYPAISTSRLKLFSIPVPPLELQEKIVAILDRFETLVNDLSKGLPAEIEAEKARYEYFRNKLLTFKEIPA